MKKLSALFLSVLLLAALGGCGGGTQEPPSPPPPEEPETLGGYPVVSAEEINSFSQDGLVLFGRTYLQNNALCLDHAGTGFEVTFYGTKLEVTLGRSHSVNLYFRTFLDGDEEGTLTKVLRTKTYTVAEGLEEGVHTVRLLKATSSYNGYLRVSELSTDGSFLRPEKRDALRIEFVGDSITVGAGIFGDTTGKGCTVDNSDATKAYSYLTAQALGADCSLVATEAICVKVHTGLNFSMLDMYRKYSAISGGDYPYGEGHDIVVIALGTNDSFYMGSNPDYTTEAFTADYIELLTLVREKNPAAKIVCVYGMMGTNEKIERGIEAAIKQFGDKTVGYCPLPADLKGADSHPSLNGAVKQSETLVRYIKSL